MRIKAILLLTGFILVGPLLSDGLAVASVQPPPGTIDTSGETRDEVLEVQGLLALPGSSTAIDQAAARGESVAPDPNAPQTRVRYVAECDQVVAEMMTACGAPCPTGADRYIPYSTVVQPGGTPPENVADWTRGQAGCYSPADPGAETVLPYIDPLLVAEVFRQTVQPATAWAHTAEGDVALVQKEFIVYATVAQRQWSGIPFLGTTLALRAEPMSYSWTFGDGSKPLVTEDPGAWYPDHTLFHQYRQPGTFSTQLTTTYTGEYSVAGGPWLPIPGTAEIASPPDPVTIVEARAVLTG